MKRIKSYNEFKINEIGVVSIMFLGFATISFIRYILKKIRHKEQSTIYKDMENIFTNNSTSNKSYYALDQGDFYKIYPNEDDVNVSNNSIIMVYKDKPLMYVDKLKIRLKKEIHEKLLSLIIKDIDLENSEIE